MPVIAINDRVASSRRMPLTLSPDAAERKLLGQALRNLRVRADMTQRDVATPLGLKPQAWQYYEAGDRKFTPDRISEVLHIIGATQHDLDVEKARILGGPAGRTAGVAEVHQDFVFDVFGRTRADDRGPIVYDIAEPLRRLDLRQLLTRSIDAMEVAGDLMSPWAESGEIVLFDRERAPRRGKGCVIEMHSGEAHVRLYEKSDGSTLFVRHLFPIEQTTTFAHKDVKGVYPVILRGD